MDTLTTAPENARTFNIDQALNKPGFSDFLAKFPDKDTLDMDDAEEIEKRFKSFELKGKTAKEVKNLYIGEIKNETGIKLEDADLAAIDEYLDEAAINNPEYILELTEQLRQFKELPAAIAQKTEELRGIEAEAAELKEKGDKLKQEHQEQKGKNLLTRRLTFSKRLKTYEKEIKELDAKTAGRGTAGGGKAADIGHDKSHLRSIRQELFQDSKIAEMVSAEAQKKTKQMFDRTLGVRGAKKATLEDTEKVAELYGKLFEYDDDDETPRLQYMSKKKTQDEYQTTINEQTENLIMRGIIEALDKLPNQGLTLDKVESSIKKFLEKQKKVGTKNAEDSKDTMLRMLEAFATTATACSDVKRLLLTRVIKKLQKT